ncbi:MAG: ATP-binding protein [Gammaproteobacteria bacterium]|nr:ATP-binding protein [Gammaproteobacteria bacterium]
MMVTDNKKRTSRADTSLKAEHEYICGNSGTGKSSYIKEIMKGYKRIIAFDPDDEYGTMPGFTRIETARELVAKLKAAGSGNFKIAFVGEGKAAFEFWCECVFKVGLCLAIAEEIADVTSPAKAPPAWGKLIRRGRKFGVKICAVTQRPAEADKTILSNAAFIRTFALGRFSDRQAISREIQLSINVMEKMRPLDWIHFARADLTKTAGRLGQRRAAIPINDNGESLQKGPAKDTIMKA